MAELKTKPTRASVRKFLNGVENERRRNDAFVLLELLQEVTGEKPTMWGESIVGYGKYSYTYPTGHSGEWFLAGFSPRKQNMVVYIMSGFSKHEELLSKLGKFKNGKSCLYINKLDDIDLRVLKKLVKKSAEYVAKHSN